MASEQINTECDQILNKYGYNKAMVDRRIAENNKISESITMMTHKMLGHSKVDKVLVGSRREGISLFGESDTDVMIILNDVLAREGSKSRKSIQKPPIQTTETNDLMSGEGENGETKKSKEDTPILLKTVFVMDKNETPAGYTLLRASSANDYEYTSNSMVKTQRGAFLCSHSFLIANKYKFRLNQGWMKSAVQYKEQNGPSLPETLPANDVYLKIIEFLTGPNYASSEKDCVIWIPCQCPSLLQKWQNRKRPYDWPTQEMIEQVISLPVHVVPVGLKRSRNEGLQWRISFTFAEVHLVHNFNDTQIKVLVLLRNIAKEKLKPISNKISSNVIKNVMFWLSESIPLRDFTKASLLELVKCGLLRLQENISSKHLPCYMLPQRNLLKTLNKKEVKRLVSMLDCIIHNDIEMLNHILNERMKKAGLEKLAAIDKMSLEFYKEITAHDIFTIT